MLTPLDIHNKVFGRSFRGYNMEEVDKFLDEIIRDQEAFFRENSEMKETIARMTEEAIKNREISSTLEKTMVLAQRVYDEEALRAKKEADIVLWEADKNAEKIIQEAQKEMLDVRQRIERLRLYEKQLYLKHKGFLEFQMELLDGYKDKETLLTEGEMEQLTLGARERDLVADEGGIRDEETVYAVYDGSAAEETGAIPPEYADAESGDAPSAEADVVEISGATDPYAVAAGFAEARSDETGTDISETDADAIGKDAVETGATAADVDSASSATRFAPSEADSSADAANAPDSEEGTATGFAAMDGATVASDIHGATDPYSVAAGLSGRTTTGQAGGLTFTIDDVPAAGIYVSPGPAPDDGSPGGSTQTETGDATDETSPFDVGDQTRSMEQVVLLAQQMEEALKALDNMYGTDDGELDQ